MEENKHQVEPINPSGLSEQELIQRAQGDPASAPERHLPMSQEVAVEIVVDSIKARRQQREGVDGGETPVRQPSLKDRIQADIKLNTPEE